MVIATFLVGASTLFGLKVGDCSNSLESYFTSSLPENSLEDKACVHLGRFTYQDIYNKLPAFGVAIGDGMAHIIYGTTKVKIIPANGITSYSIKKHTILGNENYVYYEVDIKAEQSQKFYVREEDFEQTKTLRTFLVF